MQTIVVIFHLFLALGLIGLVLIQHGKGADAGAAFGSGASATVFGARGSGSFLTRATALLAALFFLSSLVLAYFSSQGPKQDGLMDSVVQGIEQNQAAPAPAPTATDIPIAPPPASASGSPASDVPALPAGEAEKAAPTDTAGDNGAAAMKDAATAVGEQIQGKAAEAATAVEKAASELKPAAKE